MNMRAFDDLSAEARLVFDAALKNFAEFGYHGTPTRKIAQSVHKSPAAVYAHYPSKHELLFQIIIRGHEDLLSRILNAKELGTTPVERLSEVARTHAEFHAQYSAIARVANYELHNLDSNALETILQIRRQIESIVREIIAAGNERGDFDVADGNLAASAMLSMGIDVSRWYQPNGRLTVTDIGDAYAGYARRMVGITSERAGNDSGALGSDERNAEAQL